jgi:hypothetical protein
MIHQAFGLTHIYGDNRNLQLSPQLPISHTLRPFSGPVAFFMLDKSGDDHLQTEAVFPQLLSENVLKSL